MDTRNPTIDIETIFAKLPNEIFWKMFIDQIQWPLNEPLVFDYDDSPNYLSNMYKGFLLNFLTIDSPLTLDLIIGLHDYSYNQKDEKKLGLSKNQGISGLGPQSFTKNGLIELIDKIKKDEVKLAFINVTKSGAGKVISDTYNIDQNKSTESLANEIQSLIQKQNASAQVVLVRNTDVRDVKSVCAQYIERYNSEIQKAGNNEENKLTAIVKFIQDMHQYHPFQDGNGRTFIFLLLNKLLIQNGLSPTIVEYPGRFTGWSVNELVSEVTKGQLTFKGLFTTVEKKDVFLNYLQSVAPMSDEVLSTAYLMLDITKLYASEEGKNFLADNLTNLYENQLPKMTDKKKIDYIFAETPPVIDIDLSLFLINCAANANEYVLQKLMEIYPSDKFKAPETIDKIISKAKNKDDLNTFTNFMNHMQLTLTQDDMLAVLKYAINPDSNMFKGIQHHGVNPIPFDYIKLMLEKLDTKHLIDFVSSRSEGMNSLQLLALYSSDLYDSCCSRLDKKQVLSLLKEKCAPSNKKILAYYNEIRIEIYLEKMIKNLENELQQKTSISVKDSVKFSIHNKPTEGHPIIDLKKDTVLNKPIK